MSALLAIVRFQFMVAVFRLRDWWRPRREVLQDVGIRPGFHVLDFGCGTGSYIRETARLVGESGEVYALDINPLAIEAANKLAAAHGLRNVRTILSDCASRLPDESVDVVLLYDILHDLSASAEVLQEIHRVLKPSGILSMSDHHLKPADIVTRVTAAHGFRLVSSGMMTHSFAKEKEEKT
jgi:ubiquinone/menaquinone biosynthesis C-methylase UbiE